MSVVSATNVTGFLDLVKLQENTNLKLLIEELVNQKVQMKLAEAASDKDQLKPSSEGNNNNKCGKGISVEKTCITNVIKSPSDTTIYAPALRQGKCMENALRR